MVLMGLTSPQKQKSSTEKIQYTTKTCKVQMANVFFNPLSLSVVGDDKPLLTTNSSSKNILHRSIIREQCEP